MNKSLLKFITDFGPLLIFFVVYSKSGKNLSTAIPPLIVATIIAVLISYIVEKKIPYIPLIGGIIISVFGGLTLYFNNPVFLYMKPTIINVFFGFALAFERLFTKRLTVAALLEVMKKPFISMPWLNITCKRTLLFFNSNVYLML